MTLKDTIQALPDDEFRDLKAWVVTTETDRRAAQPAVEQARAEDTQKLWEAHPELKPKFETEPVEVDTSKTVTLADLLAKYPPYKQPTGAHDALPTGAIVTDEGRIWRTDLPTLNVWKPGTMNAGWVDITDELLAQANQQTQPEETDASEEPEAPETPEPEGEDTEPTPKTTEPEAPPYKQPSGAHDAYNSGDRMTYNGEMYESTVNGNVWTPDAYPQGWKKL